MVGIFEGLYRPESPRWANISAVVSDLGWSDVTAQTTAEYFDLHGVDRRWTRELVEAATRVNYGQVCVRLQFCHAGVTYEDVERGQDPRS